MAPEYIKKLVTPKKVSRYPVRSKHAIKLNVPKSKYITLGDRAFSVSAPILWNELLPKIRKMSEYESFKCHLKTHYFECAYSH